MFDRIFGHYVIDDKVGEGEFAIVYKGHDIRLDRQVAVKVLKEKHSEDRTTWGRLLREARIVSTLNHPNICKLYDIGEEQDVNYIVFEFVEGKPLRSLLQSGPLPTRTVLHYGMQIASAKAYAHAAGVLHRDFTSANIMVTPKGQIKVIDFGLAKLMHLETSKQDEFSHSSAEEIGWIIGTLPYMAPELLHGEGATTQSGVWSLGVVLFEMITGQLPFVGNSAFELGMEIMTGKGKALPADIPASIRAIIRRCLERDKENRYYSAVEVYNHLNSEFIAVEVKNLLATRRSTRARGKWFERLASVWLSLFFSLAK